MSSEQADTQGQTTYNKDDNHPHRRKVQRAKQGVPTPVKTMTVTIAPEGRKYLYRYKRRYPRKNLPLSERKQVTTGGFVYKKCETFDAEINGINFTKVKALRMP